MMKKIGEILQSRRLISAAQLEEALQIQLVNGVRLGTALVQLEVIGLTEIGRALSIQHGVPVVESEMLQNIRDAELALIPAALALKHMVVPLFLDERGLHVAMCDPLRQIAGELSFTLKRSICRYVTPELRMMYLLEKHYGAERDPRFLREETDQPQRRERRSYIGPTVTPDEGATQDVLGDDQDLVFLDQYDNTSNESAPQGDEVVVALRPLDLVIAKLADSNTGEAIARLLVGPVLDNVLSVVLFWVRGDNAVGCWARGLPDMSQLPRLVVPLQISSLLSLAFTKRRLVRSAVSKDPLHMKILQFLQLPEPGELCIAPVVLNDKVVNLLCQYSAPGEAFEPDALEKLNELSAAATLAYQRLVQQLKH